MLGPSFPARGRKKGGKMGLSVGTHKASIKSAIRGRGKKNIIFSDVVIKGSWLCRKNDIDGLKQCR